MAVERGLVRILSDEHDAGAPQESVLGARVFGACRACLSAQSRVHAPTLERDLPRRSHAVRVCGFRGDAAGEEGLRVMVGLEALSSGCVDGCCSRDVRGGDSVS